MKCFPSVRSCLLNHEALDMMFFKPDTEKSQQPITCRPLPILVKIGQWQEKVVLYN